jgi:hypothetical protein
LEEKHIDNENVSADFAGCQSGGPIIPFYDASLPGFKAGGCGGGAGMYAAWSVVGAFESVRFQGTCIAGGKLEQTVNVVDGLPQAAITIAKR